MKGVFTALATPFASDGALDRAGFGKLLEDQRAARVAGVVVCGTTGESPTLSESEKDSLLAWALEALEGSGIQVLAGTGSNDTAATVARSRRAEKLGAHGLLVVTPYYNKPSQEGLRRHFLAVADAVSCDLMLYNVPGRTGVSLAPATVASLAEHPRVRAIKEATGTVVALSEIRDALALAGRTLELFCGDDAIFLGSLAVGAHGVVSVASNLFPRAMVAIQALFEQGKTAEAAELNSRWYPLFRDLFVESNPVPLKAALAKRGICLAGVRPPLCELGPESRARLIASMARCGLADGKPA